MLTPLPFPEVQLIGIRQTISISSCDLDPQIPDRRQVVPVGLLVQGELPGLRQNAVSDFDVARWTMEHTDLLNKLIADLEEQGCELFIEHQNGFRVESSRTGAVISGRADLMARWPDGRLVVYDVKTGREAASHIVQVQLYMYLLPKSDLTRWREMPEGSLDGAVVYPGGRHVDIPAESVDDAFEARLAEFMQKMTAPVPPRRVPSGPECRFCELTKADCPERIDAGATAA